MNHKRKGLLWALAGKTIRVLPERLLLSICSVRLNPVDKSYLLSGIATCCLEHGRAQTALKLFMMSFQEILETPILTVTDLCDRTQKKVSKGLSYHLAELLTMNVHGLIAIKTYEHRFDEVDQLRMLGRSLSRQLLINLDKAGATLEDKLTQLCFLWSSLVPHPSLHDNEEARRLIRKDQEQIILVGKQLVDCFEQKALSEPKRNETFAKYTNFCGALASVLRICSKYSQADELLRRIDETRKQMEATKDE